MTGDCGSYLAVGAVLFVLGAIGFVTRRNLILIVLSTELMLHGVSLSMLAFGKLHGNMQGQSFTVFMLTVAACEAGLLLSLVMALYQKAKSLDVELWCELREMDLPIAGLTLDAGEAPLEVLELEELPQLTPAGRAPVVDDDVPVEQLVENIRRDRRSPAISGGGKG